MTGIESRVSMPDPLTVAIGACAVLAGLSVALSIATREYSWVDRMWSIAPVLYVAWFAASAGRLEPRLVLMTALVAAWGVRLTYNFARKGGYSRGGEDYRWKELRHRMSPASFAVFNVLFISTFQNVLLLLLSLPARVAAREGPTPLGALDAAAAALFVAFLAGEIVADQQQWRFHSEKAARARNGLPEGQGFLSKGLFRYSRHPNFFCEQGLWWSFYLFGVAAGAAWLNVSILGPLILTALFHGSTRFTESISASKYPAYADYQRRTSRLIPWFPRGRSALRGESTR
jgi:steroid 5-alpha reductase family enzyme